MAVTAGVVALGTVLAGQVPYSRIVNAVKEPGAWLTYNGGYDGRRHSPLSEINTINVIRVMRTHVSFTSTLPRKAYVITCPACRKLLSAGLSGLL